MCECLEGEKENDRYFNYLYLKIFWRRHFWYHYNTCLLTGMTKRIATHSILQCFILSVHTIKCLKVVLLLLRPCPELSCIVYTADEVMGMLTSVFRPISFILYTDHISNLRQIVLKLNVFSYKASRILLSQLISVSTFVKI